MTQIQVLHLSSSARLAHRCRAFLLGLAACFSFVTNGSFAVSAPFILEAVDSGWYWHDANGYLHQPSNTNFIVGHDDASQREYRNFFVFDLSSISLEIASATFQAEQSNTSNRTPPFVVWNLFDVSTDLLTLRTASNPQATFEDLGSGETFGQFIWNTPSKTVSVVLNPAALEEINASNGLWAFGGSTINTSKSFDILFNGSDARHFPRLLVTVVPEPSVCALAVLAAICIVFSRIGRHSDVLAAGPREAVNVGLIDDDILLRVSKQLAELRETLAQVEAKLNRLAR